MFVLITFILIFLCIAAVVTLRLTRLGSAYTWLIVVGVLLSWASVLLWQIDLPWRFTPGQWMPAGLFNAAPQFLADPFAWLYALSLIGLAAAIILTSPARSGQVGAASWGEILLLTVLGLLAVLVDNVLGLALAWVAIDLVGFVLALRRNTTLSERSLLSFVVRLSGLGFGLWAAILATSLGQPAFSLAASLSSVSLFLMMAIGLRIGALPPGFEQSSDDDAGRRGVNVMYNAVSAASALIVLARIPVAAMDGQLMLLMLTAAVLAAIYSGWKWLFAADEAQGRPYWLTGLSALSLAACLSGSAAGSTAWGVCLILFGGLSALYVARQVWLTRIFALAVLFMLALPFTLTASVWEGALPLPFVFLPLFGLAHVLFAAGYLRNILRAEGADFAQLPNWSQTAYSLGMGMLLLTMLLGSLWGWPGSLTLGNWWVGLVVFLLTGVVLFASSRLKLPQFGLPKLLRTRRGRPLRLPSMLNILIRIFSFFYQMIGSLTIYISDLLEGDGGLLWTLLLLILLISFLRGL